MADQRVLEGFNAGAARVALTGAVRTAPVGTTVGEITDKYDDSIFHNLGYISPDGVEISFDEEKQEYIPWQEASAIRVDITQATTSVKMTLWETGPGQLARFLGVPQGDLEDLAGGGQGFWQKSLPEFEHVQLNVDMIDKRKHKRVTFLDAQISERGALVLKKDEIFGLEMTYTTFPAGHEYRSTQPEAVGNTARWQFNEDWKAAGEITSATDGVAALTVTSASLPEGTVGQEYTAKLSATGGTGSYTWSVDAGSALPDGLSLSADGTISGTPTTEDLDEVTFKVTDGGGLMASKALTVTINAA